VDKFYYLGDLIGAEVGAEEASRARVRCIRAKFSELAPVLTSRGASLKVKRTVHKASIQRVLGCVIETCSMTERMMVR